LTIAVPFDEWEERLTDFILGIILQLRTVIQIDIIYFCLEKRDSGSGLLYPIMGFGQIYYTKKWVFNDLLLDQLMFVLKQLKVLFYINLQ